MLFDGLQLPLRLLQELIDFTFEYFGPDTHPQVVEMLEMVGVSVAE